MTITDLYNYAKEEEVENCEVEIQYADGGGFHHGTRDLREDEIEVEDKGYGKIVVL
jgi:hypothetical protein